MASTSTTLQVTMCHCGRRNRRLDIARLSCISFITRLCQCAKCARHLDMLSSAGPPNCIFSIMRLCQLCQIFCSCQARNQTTTELNISSVPVCQLWHPCLAFCSCYSQKTKTCGARHGPARQCAKCAIQVEVVQHASVSSVPYRLR